MIRTVTIDSSVFIAGLLEYEPEYKNAIKLLKQVYDNQIYVALPATVLTEITAAINRRVKDPVWAKSVMQQLLLLPNLEFIDITKERAINASETAMRTGLRGMDGKYCQRV